MIIAELPPNEQERLATLYKLNLLDTPTEERFDRITRTASRLFNVPVALISLIDLNRQWFKSCFGFNINETSRDISFCAHAILDDEVLVIRDTLNDPRFAENPLVTGEPYIRFYAGQPLYALDGAKLGTLCILDIAPRIFSEEEREVLGDLAKWAERELNTIELQEVMELRAEAEYRLQQSEQQLALVRDQALEASRLKSEFLANMSHEIRTPMNGVVGMTNLLEQTKLNDQQREMVRVIRTSGEALLTVINDILDFSKIEAGKLTLENVSFNPHEVVNDVVQLLSTEANRKNLSVTSIVDADIPAVLYGDPVRLRQILLNLIGNAVKFTEHGKITVQAWAECTMGTTVDLRFAVVDTGVGILPETLVHMFQPFTQADGSITRKFGGTGLGLAICKRLVEMMGGDIGVESTPAQGSTFWFTLKFSNKAEHEMINEEMVNAREKLISRKPILLVEDNEINQRLTMLQLERLGYTAHVASSGQEALDAVARVEYALVLMDCQMPEMDGLETTRLIRQNEIGTGHRVPIIALTANAMESDKLSCLAAGMDDFLTKPTDLQRLSETLVRITGQPITSRAETLLSSLSEHKANLNANTSLPTFDVIAINKLRKMIGDNDPGFLENSINVFLEHTASMLNTLEQAVATQSTQEVRRLAHTLKSSGASYGGVQFSHLCKLLEMAAREGNLDGAAKQVEKLKFEYDRLKIMLEAESNRKDI